MQKRLTIEQLVALSIACQYGHVITHEKKDLAVIKSLIDLDLIMQRPYAYPEPTDKGIEFINKCLELTI